MQQAKKVLQLRVDQIRTDGGTQARAAMCDEAVEEWADVLREGGELPSVVVFWDGRHYWLADGFHRLEAHVLAGHRVIYAEVYDGTRRDAVLYAVGSNWRYGVRRTNADKRRAVGVLLADPEWSQWSNLEIARRCHASEFLVRTVRDELSSIKSKIEERKVERNGSAYIMNTAAIGVPSRGHVGPAPAAKAPDEYPWILDALACLEQARESLSELGERGAGALAAVDVALAEVAAIR